MRRREQKSRPIVNKTECRDGIETRIETGIYEEVKFHPFPGRSRAARLEGGWSIDYFLESIAEDARQARESSNEYVASEGGAVLAHLSMLREFVAAGDLRHCIFFAFAVGRFYEAMTCVRPLEHRALAGLNQSRRNRSIALDNALTDDELRSRYEAVQTELAAQAKRGDRINRERAYRHVAEQLGLTDSGAVKKSYRKWAKRVG